MTVSPLAPKSTAALPSLKGVRLAAMEAGIKYKGRKDLLLVLFDDPTQVAGVFTRSKCPSAPVDWCRRILSNGTARAVVVNSGNANAFTGRKGSEAAAHTAQAAASVVGCHEDEVFLASTGVIGEPLDASGFDAALASLANELSDDGWADAAAAIMTTDTYPKLSTRTIEIDGVAVTVNGIAKGSGMIAPDMATMLSFIVTDAPVASDALQSILGEATDQTFNCVTVDSDTSTSDTVLIFATGKAAIKDIRDASDQRYLQLKQAVDAVSHDLAMQIVRDGEGASKHVEIALTGAKSNGAAKCIAMAIANSPLVKTAIAGEDPNWGRIVAAVGKAGEEADRDKLAIWFGDVRVAVNGERDPDYIEEIAAAVMRHENIKITVDLGIGDGLATVWTCDLTKEYVAINADYRS